MKYVLIWLIINERGKIKLAAKELFYLRFLFVSPIYSFVIYYNSSEFSMPMWNVYIYTHILTPGVHRYTRDTERWRCFPIISKIIQRDLSVCRRRRPNGSRLKRIITTKKFNYRRWLTRLLLRIIITIMIIFFLYKRKRPNFVYPFLMNWCKPSIRPGGILFHWNWETPRQYNAHTLVCHYLSSLYNYDPSLSGIVHTR